MTLPSLSSTSTAYAVGSPSKPMAPVGNHQVHGLGERARHLAAPARRGDRVALAREEQRRHVALDRPALGVRSGRHPRTRSGWRRVNSRALRVP